MKERKEYTMFPPNSPLTERTRIRNERLLADQKLRYAGKAGLPGKTLFAAMLRRLTFRRPEIKRAERQTAKTSLEQLEA